MLGTFSTISPHIKLFKTREISINNLVCKFHYRGTFLILLVCTLLVTARQYVGEHIRCMTGGAPTIPEHVINTFCFFTTTFTVIRHFNESMLQSGTIPHPGIGPMEVGEPIRHHAYYQWVPFFLFSQALMFYFPHHLWKGWEGGKIKALVEGLQMVSISKHSCTTDDVDINKDCRILSKSTTDGRVTIIRTEFLKHIQINRFWAYRFIFCEILNVANLILQIFVTNRFLGGLFFRLGIDFIQDDFKGLMDPLDVIFPKVTKCHFFKYGPSGTIQKHDALCVMALNVINEKIFTFLWFWFIFLAFVSLIGFIWRITTICLYNASETFNGYVFSMASPGRLNQWDMLVVMRQLCYSDWLFLLYLAKNMEPYLFRELLTTLSDEIVEEEEEEEMSEADVSEDEGKHMSSDEEESVQNKLNAVAAHETLLNEKLKLDKKE